MISDDRTIIANSCRVRRHQISSNAIEHLTATHLQNVPPSDIFKIGKSSEFTLPEPYEPLIIMYERGGIFSMEHGFFDFAVGSFPRGKWQQYDAKMAAEWANPQIEALLSESAIAVNPSLVAHREHSHGDRGNSH